MITCQAAPLRRGATRRRYTIAVRTPAFLLLRLALAFGVPAPTPQAARAAAPGGSPGRWLVVPANGLKVLVTPLVAIARGRR